ncbi:MAG: IPT/TIG domain-containing protein [Candidatus Acidiferrales bacterium]
MLTLTALMCLTGAPLSTRLGGIQVAGVTPDSGLTTPGSVVDIHGIGFAPDAIVYFGGVQARDTRFLGDGELEVATPYLRPGTYSLQVKTVGVTVRSSVKFKVLPSPVDGEIDRAVNLAVHGDLPGAISILDSIARDNQDYQVRAFAHYQASQLYYARGDWWRWKGEAALIYADARKSGMAVQTSWRYRLAMSESEYLLDSNPKPDFDLRMADLDVAQDVTDDPEPRFYRALINARYGNLHRAKMDSDFILGMDPNNASYQALAAYVGVLSGDSSRLQSIPYSASIKDARALRLLGEAAFLGGDGEGGQRWWSQAVEADPLGAKLSCLAGKKHFARGHEQVAAALLTGCTTMAPSSNEAKDAKDLLAKLPTPLLRR